MATLVLPPDRGNASTLLQGDTLGSRFHQLFDCQIEEAHRYSRILYLQFTLCILHVCVLVLTGNDPGLAENARKIRWNDPNIAPLTRPLISASKPNSVSVTVTVSVTGQTQRQSQTPIHSLSPTVPPRSVSLNSVQPVCIQMDRGRPTGPQRQFEPLRSNRQQNT